MKTTNRLLAVLLSLVLLCSGLPFAFAEDDATIYGTDGNLVTMRCYYKDGKAVWARVEFDINGVWCLWNFGNQFDYNLETDGYKTMK